ncbi:MAG: enolase C-terminal domain-like protein, partial [Gemmatimonadales bacterium]
MKITRVTAWPVDMPLVEPYTIAYETIAKTTNVFVRLETSTGVAGCGCAAPDLQVTGESSASVVDAMRDIAEPVLMGEDPLRVSMLLERLRPSLRPHPSAFAAVDMALHDALARVAGLPLWRLLGGFRDRIETSVTIGIRPQRETVHRARALVGQRYRCLKLKGGRDVEADIARVLAVREAVGPEVELRFDANQGYTVEEAQQFVTATRSAHVAVFEQPTPAGQPGLLGAVA